MKADSNIIKMTVTYIISFNFFFSQAEEIYGNTSAIW